VSNGGKAGYVYILTNESYRANYLKIGLTTHDPRTRASEISSPTGVATPFAVAFCEAVPDCHEAEKLVHRMLAKHRVNSDREFFEVELDQAIEVVRSIGIQQKGLRKLSLLDRGTERTTDKRVEKLESELKEQKKLIHTLQDEELQIKKQEQDLKQAELEQAAREAKQHRQEQATARRQAQLASVSSMSSRIVRRLKQGLRRWASLLWRGSQATAAFAHRLIQPVLRNPSERRLVIRVALSPLFLLALLEISLFWPRALLWVLLFILAVLTIAGVCSPTHFEDSSTETEVDDS
jgi:hypothetical protein